MISEKERAEEVARLEDLQPKIPARTFFGDDNRASVDAEIWVIENNVLGEKEIVDRWPGDDDESTRLFSAAMDARAWLAGEDGAERPSAGWVPLVRK